MKSGDDLLELAEQAWALMLLNGMKGLGGLHREGEKLVEGPMTTVIPSPAALATYWRKYDSVRSIKVARQLVNGQKITDREYA